MSIFDGKIVWEGVGGGQNILHVDVFQLFHSDEFGAVLPLPAPWRVVCSVEGKTFFFLTSNNFRCDFHGFYFTKMQKAKLETMK